MRPMRFVQWNAAVVVTLAAGCVRPARLVPLDAGPLDTCAYRMFAREDGCSFFIDRKFYFDRHKGELPRLTEQQINVLCNESARPCAVVCQCHPADGSKAR